MFWCLNLQMNVTQTELHMLSSLLLSLNKYPPTNAVPYIVVMQGCLPLLK